MNNNIKVDKRIKEIRVYKEYNSSDPTLSDFTVKTFALNKTSLISSDDNIQIYDNFFLEKDVFFFLFAY